DIGRIVQRLATTAPITALRKRRSPSPPHPTGPAPSFPSTPPPPLAPPVPLTTDVLSLSPPGHGSPCANAGPRIPRPVRSGWPSTASPVCTPAPTPPAPDPIPAPVTRSRRSDARSP